MMKATSQRMEHLDSIRGLAALAVLLSHSLIFEWPAPITKAVNLPFVNLAFNGKEAVAMFFVLSGYVLAVPYLTEKMPGGKRKIYLPSFYARRFTRIWLPWFFAFFASMLAQRFLFRDWTTNPPLNEWAAQFWHVPQTWESCVRQCLFVLHDARVQLLSQDWSLGIELKASVLLPLFVVLASGWRQAALALFAAGLAWKTGTGIFYTSFIMGVVLAGYGRQILAWPQLASRHFKLGLLLAGLTLYQGQQLMGPGKISWLVTSLGCILILVAVLASARLQAFLQLSPLVFLGRISYSVYLLQFIVILCVLPPLMHWLNQLGVKHPALTLPVTLGVSVGGVVLLAAISYRWVELPCIRLGAWLSQKFILPGDSPAKR